MNPAIQWSTLPTNVLLPPNNSDSNNSSTIKYIAVPMETAPAKAYRYLAEIFVNLIKTAVKVKAIANPIITTPYKSIPKRWKSKSKTSSDEMIPIGISTEFNQIKLEIEEIGVINKTVSRAAEKTANGYFAIFIF